MTEPMPDTSGALKVAAWMVRGDMGLVLRMLRAALLQPRCFLVEEMLGRFILALPIGIDNRRHGARSLGPQGQH